MFNDNFYDKANNSTSGTSKFDFSSLVVNITDDDIVSVLDGLNVFKADDEFLYKVFSFLVTSKKTKLLESLYPDLKYLFDNESACDEFFAVAEGNYLAFRYATEHCNVNKNDEYICRNAIHSKNMKCLRYALENDYYFDKDTFLIAVMESNLEALKILNEFNCVIDETSCYQSILRNAFDCFVYVNSIGCKFTLSDCYLAISNKNGIKYIKHMHSTGYTFESEVLDYCIKFKNLEILKFIRKTGCEYTNTSHLTAAVYGSTKLFKHIHEDGCTYTDETIYKAKLHNNDDAVRYLSELGYKNSIENQLVLKYVDKIFSHKKLK